MKIPYLDCGDHHIAVYIYQNLEMDVFVCKLCLNLKKKEKN